MGEIKVEKDTASMALKNLAILGSKNRGLRFKVGDYMIIPKVVTITNNREYFLVMFSDKLAKLINHYHLKSAIFDALGIHKENVTQIQIFDSGTVVYSPSINRDPEKIRDLIKKLSQAQ